MKFLRRDALIRHQFRDAVSGRTAQGAQKLALMLYVLHRAQRPALAAAQGRLLNQSSTSFLAWSLAMP
jgi:hypothetical protein